MFSNNFSISTQWKESPPPSSCMFKHNFGHVFKAVIHLHLIFSFWVASGYLGSLIFAWVQFFFFFVILLLCVSLVALLPLFIPLPSNVTVCPTLMYFTCVQLPFTSCVFKSWFLTVCLFCFSFLWEVSHLSCSCIPVFGFSDFPVRISSFHALTIIQQKPQVVLKTYHGKQQFAEYW